MKCLSLNIVMTYPVHWSRYQVIRDFVQNFYDAAGYKDWRQRFRYAYDQGVLSMWIDGVSFNYEWLMHIGASTKTGQSDSYAGFFGEGFKIASLCAFRDLKWEIEMMSADWCLNVTQTDHYIDQTCVKMLAYNIFRTDDLNRTKLILKHVSPNDFDLFQAVLDSFYSPDNPIMGELLWQGDAGAVFLRSRQPINKSLPVTTDFGRKGAVFCGYQMLGTCPFNLVVCLHRYRKEDRERKSLYSFDVVDVFESISSYVSPHCASVMLEKMRKYWNTYPRRKIDIHSWSSTIDHLIYKVSRSPDEVKAFNDRHPDLLCLKQIYSVGERNRRWQARAWLEQQDRKYTLVKYTFTVLGYPTLERTCELNGGFVVDDSPDEIQEKCFGVLEEICRKVFQGFFPMERMPERKIITNSHAAYHGMAVLFRSRQSGINIKGIRIRYDVGKIYLKSELFKKDGYFDGLSTYIHEMCHMFGHDASASFSLALTFTLELMMSNQDKVLAGKKEWDQIFLHQKHSYSQAQADPGCLC